MATDRENPGKVMPIAIVIIGIVAGYLFYSLTIKGNSLGIPPPAKAQDETLSKLKDISLDFSFFDDPRFKSLKIFGESPVQPGVTGRVDIFAPY